MTEGIITKGIGGFYYVAADGVLYECRARGKFRKKGIKPVVGDRVKITVVNQNPPEGAVDEIAERKNCLIRPPVTNVDCIVIVVAATKPQPDYFMIDKLIVTAERAGIEVIVAANKTDLQSDEKIRSIYEKAGYDVFAVCAKTGVGVDALKTRIKGKVTAFAGNSGVGKSSLLNHFGLNLETGDVSKIERGKHTTRHVELFETAPDTFVMDTPGFSILDIDDIEHSELKKFFIEFEACEGTCRFADCDHIGTRGKDCIIVDAVTKGQIPTTRYESYNNLYTALKEIKKWEK